MGPTREFKQAGSELMVVTAVLVFSQSGMLERLYLDQRAGAFLLVVRV
jgi:hypothetical protein